MISANQSDNTQTIPAPVAFSRRGVLLLMAVAAAAFAFNIWHGLDVDEYTSWAKTRMAPMELIENRLTAGHFPTYFLMLWQWVRIFGITEAAMRLPSLLMTLAALLCFRRLAADLFGRQTAGLATAIFCLHQLVIWTAQQARPYAGALLGTTLTAMALARWWNNGRARWLALTAAAAVLGFSFLPSCAMTMAAFALALCRTWPRAPRKALAAQAALLAPLALLILPALLLAEKQHNYAIQHDAWLFRPLKMADALSRVVFGDYQTWAGKWFAAASVTVFIILCWGATRQLRRGSIPAPGAALASFPRAAFVWCWAFTPIIILMIAEGLIGESLLSHPRYLVPALGGLILIIALGLSPLTFSPSRAAPWKYAPAAIVLALMLPCTVAWWRDRGDGPAVLARAMTARTPGVLIAGYAHILHYEYMREMPKPLLPIDGLSESQARDQLKELPPDRPFWLFVYNNKRDPLDAIIASPPEGWRAALILKYRDARSALFQPAKPPE
ncbi:MAG: glycosyltransferase family 39 protein [bacterium]